MIYAIVKYENKKDIEKEYQKLNSIFDDITYVPKENAFFCRTPELNNCHIPDDYLIKFAKSLKGIKIEIKRTSKDDIFKTDTVYAN